MEKVLDREEFSKIYLEKCANHEDCINKLKELVYTSGLNIEFDLEKEEAYLVTEERKIPMKKQNGIYGETYLLEVQDNLVGFYFKKINATLDFDLEIEVFVKNGDNFRAYTYRQSYFEMDTPWFYYNEYVDGIGKSFSTNCHSAYFTESNIPNRSILSIGEKWYNTIKVNRFKRIDAQKFAFGAIGHHEGYDEFGHRTFLYSPLVESEVVKNNKSELHLLFNDGCGPVQTHEVKRRYYYSGNHDDGSFYPFYKMKENYLNPRKPFQVFSFDDPEILNYCVDILKRDEVVEFYEKMKDYLLTETAGRYINKYCMNILAGIEYYQNIYKSKTPNENIDKFAKMLDLKQVK